MLEGISNAIRPEVQYTNVGNVPNKTRAEDNCEHLVTIIDTGSPVARNCQRKTAETLILLEALNFSPLYLQ